MPKTEVKRNYIRDYFVPKFMSYVVAPNWTVKDLESACHQLRQVIDSYIGEIVRSERAESVILPTAMSFPDIRLPDGESIHSQIEHSSDFVRGRYYSGWFKSLYESESFDSYSGEYKLAMLMNTSPDIVWWHRLHRSCGAYINYSPRDRYYPDFVALDLDGVHWIIEGKDMRGRDNEAVQAKRQAAEQLVRRLAANAAYTGQYWGYLIAYEDDIAEAESWDDLKSLSQPVSNRI